MHYTTFLYCLLATSTTGWAQYTLQQDFFEGGNFFDQFNFWTASDPTQGFVEYVDQGTAQAGGMISNGNGSIMMGVNSQDQTSTGRQSVRLTSKQTYQSGLVVLDLAHMPGGICGTWPAFWMVGPDWPSQGEIDIIEGVNNQQTNQMTLHTGSACNVQSSPMLGKLFSGNCDVSGGDNTGCPITTTDTQTYGSGFNQQGGGTWAMEWTSSAIVIWFFPRGREPQDLASGKPNPSSWGSAMANFVGCDISSNFKNQQIVFDTTFCGQWAGEVWGGSSCAQSTGAGSCEEYVGQNPSAFKDAYWTVNSLKVYSGNGLVTGPSNTTEASGSAAASQPAQTSGGFQTQASQTWGHATAGGQTSAWSSQQTTFQRSARPTQYNSWTQTSQDNTWGNTWTQTSQYNSWAQTSDDWNSQPTDTWSATTQGFIATQTTGVFVTADPTGGFGSHRHRYHAYEDRNHFKAQTVATTEAQAEETPQGYHNDLLQKRAHHLHYHRHAHGAGGRF